MAQNKKENHYIFFPVVLLKDANTNIREAIKYAICYYLFAKYPCTQSDAQKFIKATLRKEMESKFRTKFPDATGEMLFSAVPPNSPKASIKEDMLLDYYSNTKTQFEIETFMFFAGIRSILQSQPFVKITNEYLIGRVAGIKPGEPVPDNLFKYTHRYWLDKIKEELQDNWYLNLFGDHCRGFYVSFQNDINQLAIEAELRRKKYKREERKELRKAAREAALAAIKKNKK